MKDEDKLRELTGSDTGYRVPDGYFDSFRNHLMENLPVYPEKPKMRPLNAWQRLKPYVYLAAMFCGIWCMMKIFHDISSRSEAGLDNMPESVVLALSDQETAEFITSAESGEIDLMLEEEVSMMYDNIDELSADFGYTFKPEYSKIDDKG